MDTQRLIQKLDLLKQRAHASVPAVHAIEHWLLAHQDSFAISRITPIKIAEDSHLPLPQIVPEFLHAVPLGLFDLNWDIHCPHCYMLTKAYNNLQQASGQGYCSMCEVGFETDFSEQVEITFSLNKSIDEREFPPVCEPPPQFDSRFNLGVPYLQTATAEEIFLEAGTYNYFCPATFSKGKLIIADEGCSAPQEFHIKQLAEGKFDPPVIQARKGTIRLSLTNLAYPISGLRVFAGEVSDLTGEHRPATLSGLDILHYPDFRKLFGEQVLSKREQMKVASVTIIFTDITGSTQLYEKLGDAKAYNIVRDHFDILFSQIEAEGGVVLKTIGDAVMASFTNSGAAVRSLVAALKDFDHYNHELPEDARVQIKTGMHHGQAILVNLNERLDYFGSTVNKAARIQGVANSGEICFSEQVYQDASFQAALTQLKLEIVSRDLVNLKGLDGQQVVYKTHLPR